MVGWHHQLNGHEFEQILGMVKDRVAWHVAAHGVAKSGTWLSNWTAIENKESQRNSHLLEEPKEMSWLSGIWIHRYKMETKQNQKNLKEWLLEGINKIVNIKRKLNRRHACTNVDLLKNFKKQSFLPDWGCFLGSGRSELTETVTPHKSTCGSSVEPKNGPEQVY